MNKLMPQITLLATNFSAFLQTVKIVQIAFTAAVPERRFHK